MTDQEVWWRVEGITYAPPIDEFENIIGSSRQELTWQNYPVIRHTPKGVWVQDNWISPTRQRFILKDPNGKRLCYADKKDALNSFIARKRRAASILRHRLREIERFENLAMSMEYQLRQKEATTKVPLDVL